MDELIKEYARILDKVYTDQTKGDFTFEGILSEFAEHAREHFQNGA